MLLTGPLPGGIWRLVGKTATYLHINHFLFCSLALQCDRCSAPDLAIYGRRRQISKFENFASTLNPYSGIALIETSALNLAGFMAVGPDNGRAHGIVPQHAKTSTSVHHLVDRLGVELGYRMSEDTGYDVEDCITCATKGLKLRVASR